MGLDDEDVEKAIGEGLLATGFDAADPDAGDDNPYYVPPEERVEVDHLDPNSVANPFGEDLGWVDPEEGDIVDIQAMAEQEQDA